LTFMNSAPSIDGGSENLIATSGSLFISFWN
jgi:hypothetical protein